jgi:hypothetical protein
MENRRQGVVYCFFLLPSGQRLGDRVHKGDAPIRVCYDHGVTDTGQSDAKPLMLLAYDLLCSLTLGNLLLQGGIGAD